MKFLENIIKSINTLDVNCEDEILLSEIDNKLDKLTEDEIYKVNKQLNKNGRIVMENLFNYYYQ